MTLGSAFMLRVLVCFPNEYSCQSHEVNVARQMERLRCIESPKIVIIGGSGSGFGFCSPIISKHFGMPVCNTGTHAGLGILTQLRLCQDYINEGDIVLVIPEYGNYNKNKNGYLGDVANLRILTSVYPKGYETFSIKQQLHLLKYVPKAFDDAIKARGLNIGDDSPYSQKSLNSFGDIEMYDVRIHLDDKDWTPEKCDGFKFQKQVVCLLQSFFRFCEQKNAIMLLFPPAFKAMDYDVNEEFIQTIWDALRNVDLPIAAWPERYRLNDTMFYDTRYHLTYDGVLIRTQMVIEDIEDALNSR